MTGTADTDRVTSSQRLAQAFTTGAAAHGYRLSAIQLQVGSFNAARSTYDDDFSFAIHTSHDGLPASLVHALNRQTGGAGLGVQTFTAPAGATLDRNTTYFVVVSSTRATSTLTLRRTTWSAEDTGGLAGWSIANRGRYGTGGSSWSSVNVNPLMLRVRAHDAPPPAADSGAAAGNLAQIPGAGAAVTGPAQVAQAFTTGPIAAGYELKSVQVQFDSFSGIATTTHFEHPIGDFGRAGFFRHDIYIR